MLALAAEKAITNPRRKSAASVGFALHGTGRTRERGRGVPSRSAPPESLTSFGQHLRENPVPRLDAQTNTELVKILEALATGFREVSLLLRYGLRTANDSLEAQAIRVQGADKYFQREVLRQDQRIAEILIEALKGTSTSCVALETHEGVIDLSTGDEDDVDTSTADVSDATAPDTSTADGNDVPSATAPQAEQQQPSEPAQAEQQQPSEPAKPPKPFSFQVRNFDYYTAATPASCYTPPAPRASTTKKRPSFVVVLDPLGHAQNVDLGVSVGTIFGIYEALPRDSNASPFRDPLLSQVLRKGTELCAAGYALYGASTQLVVSCGKGVDGFTLHPVLDRFTLTRPVLQMPPVGKFYSVNFGHRHEWPAEVKTHIEDLCQSKSLRYSGTFIADVHRTLIYGGVFFYPPSRKRPAGKLRLLYEIAPIAFLMEQAGGGCTTGRERVLEIVCSSINKCVPVAFGSLYDVNAFLEACSTPQPSSNSSPLCASPTATRKGILMGSSPPEVYIGSPERSPGPVGLRGLSSSTTPASAMVRSASAMSIASGESNASSSSASQTYDMGASIRRFITRVTVPL